MHQQLLNVDLWLILTIRKLLLIQKSLSTQRVFNVSFTFIPQKLNVDKTLQPPFISTSFQLKSMVNINHLSTII